MRRPWAALRLRLAATGFCAIYFPVLIVLGVVFATSYEEESTAPVAADEAVSQVDSAEEPNTSPWVVATVLALAPLAAATAWWWAGRAVRPISDIQNAVDDIHGGRLGGRLELERGPTEVLELAASFDDMLDRLEAAAEVQRRLIEETSHELRTPLAVLTTNAEVLLASPDPTTDTFAAGLQRSRDTAARLTTIIDELLVDARGRARTVHRQPVDLVRLTREAIDAVNPLAEARRTKISLDSPDQLAGAVDSSSVLRAITNLLDNALRYSGTDTTVEVEVSGSETEARVVVTDHGPGIRATDQAVVFQRYWQADADAAGSGLGLPIVQHIAAAHGGSIGVTSPGPTGDGSRFELRLPIGVRARPGVEQQLAQTEPASNETS